MTPRQLIDRRLEAICARHGLTISELIQQDKRPHLVQARQDAWLDISLELDWSVTRMGRRLNRHYSTIVYGRQKAAERRFGLAPNSYIAAIRQAAVVASRAGAAA
jgi:chromosomal replication initiation ATPase DnaA